MPSPNLAGKYKLLTWLTGSSPKRIAPGTMLELSHEDAVRYLASGTVRALTPEELDLLDAPAAPAAKAPKSMPKDKDEAKPRGSRLSAVSTAPATTAGPEAPAATTTSDPVA